MKPIKLIITALISVCIGGCSSQKEPQEMLLSKIK